ncbi:MAG: 2-dehydropantoate 2-reductase, partial [Deltaproteobacteria bacterium]
MRYLVLGAGAMGSVFGGLLAEAGHDVTFVGLDAHLEAMKKKGLRITGIWGEHYLAKVKAYYGIDGLKGLYCDFDVVLLSVKSYLTARV